MDAGFGWLAWPLTIPAFATKFYTYFLLDSLFAGTSTSTTWPLRRVEPCRMGTDQQRQLPFAVPRCDSIPKRTRQLSIGPFPIEPGLEMMPDPTRLPQ